MEVFNIQDNKLYPVANLKKKLFWLTPLGRADKETRKYLDQREPDANQVEEYEECLNKYKAYKGLNNVVKVLLYAGIITSIATTLGFEQIQIIIQIASYIGVTMLLALFTITTYLAQLYREEMYVKREIMISEAGR